MTQPQIKRPVLWALRGTSDPILQAVYSNDTEITAVSFYYATSATAADSAWTSLGDTSKPSPVVNPYVSKTHTSAGFTTTYYYRARQITASMTGPWSNVVASNVETFLFQLRSGFGLLRGLQLEPDTDNSTRGVTWFEAMEIMLQVHNQMREYLSKRFSDTDIAEIWANPPPEIVQIVQAEVSRRILVRSDIDSRMREMRIKMALEERRISEADMLRDGILVLANGETKEFNPSPLLFA